MTRELEEEQQRGVDHISWNREELPDKAVEAPCPYQDPMYAPALPSSPQPHCSLESDQG